MSGGTIDFFVSHAGADRAWAEWVAWQLTDAGYTVELDVWDWAAGQNFITAMTDALDRCDRVVALFSAAYFNRDRYSTEEWSASMLYVPGESQRRLVPVRIEDVPASHVPPVLRPLMTRDLFGLTEEQARQALLEAAAGPRRPGHEPVFPGHGTSRQPSRPDMPHPEFPGQVPPGHAPASVAGRIFLNYRRDDTPWPSGWLYHELAEHFGKDQIFKDIDSIRLGDDFADVIGEAVERCDVLLAVIGQGWLTSSDKDGRRRLDDPDDFVRLEIEAAIKRNVRIIPILVDGAPMPHADELPPSLVKLARRQALSLSHSGFKSETGRLLGVLDTEVPRSA